jgi:hypothetical protein
MRVSEAGKTKNSVDAEWLILTLDLINSLK